MRSPLTETIYKVQGMISYVRENLSTDEFMLFLDLLLPQPEPEIKPVKKARKKSASKKSSRASSLEQQIKTNASSNRPRVLRGGSCAQTLKLSNGDRPCEAPEDDAIHDPTMGYAGYHPFSPAAPTASDSSSANDGAGDLQVSSEMQPEDVSNAVHAGD